MLSTLRPYRKRCTPSTEFRDTPIQFPARQLSTENSRMF
jgi:hypothetical protein